MALQHAKRAKGSDKAGQREAADDLAVAVAQGGAAAGMDTIDRVRDMDRIINEAHRIIEESDIEQLAGIYDAAGALGKRAWVIQAHCLAVAKARKVHANDGSIKEVAHTFGLSQSQASAMIRIWEKFGREFEDLGAPYDRLVGVSWYKTAAYTRDPKRWIEHAARRVAEDPSFRHAEFREDIARAKAIESPEDSAPARVAALPATVLRPVERRDDQDQARLRERTAEYRLLLDAFAQAIKGTGPLVHQTGTEELARALGPLTAREQGYLESFYVVANWMMRVTEARRALTTGDQAAATTLAR